MTTSAILGFLAFAINAAAGIWWMRLIDQVRVAEHRRTVVVAVMAGSLLAVLAIIGEPGGAWVIGEPGGAGGIGEPGGAGSMGELGDAGVSGEPGGVGSMGASGAFGRAAAVTAWIAAAAGVIFFAVLLASRQARKVAAVAVGAPIVRFTVPDADGNPFDLASMAGRPYLLKFFRGHWCPYCVAELKRWEDMRPELDRRGIALVAVCIDRPEKIRAGRHRHGARITLLSDPDLVVTAAYNLVNHRGLSPWGLVRLPIPTTILVDAAGIVRWIDQATDYTVRSHPDRVLAAIHETMGGAPPHDRLPEAAPSRAASDPQPHCSLA